MADAGEVLTLVVVLAISAGSLWLMHTLFGLVGVGLTLAFLLPVIGVIAYLGGGDGGSEYQGRQSKGARQEE
jgi:hypothetical protein